MQNKINEFIFYLFAAGGKGYSCGGQKLLLRV